MKAALVIVLATLEAVGVTMAIMSSVTPAHAQQGVGGECHTTGKPDVGTVGCTEPSTASGGGLGIVPLDTMCTHKGCHSATQIRVLPYFLN